MYRRTYDELMKMLESYKDILSKGFPNEAKLRKNNPSELEKIISKECEAPNPFHLGCLSIIAIE